MSDILGVASNAVTAYQRALSTVSNNIANVATDGYSRQEVVLEANPVSRIGNIYMGTGVMVDRIQRQYDAFTEANLRNSASDLASQEPMVNYANRVIDVMGGQTMGLTSALDQFFSSARSLSTDPSSTVVRGSFMRDADGLASRFGQLSSQLDLVQEETNQAIDSSVGQMNTLIQQLAQVNKQLTKNKTADAQPADLLDQRDQLLKNLATFAHVNTRFSENGEVLVSLGPSVTQDIVVDGDKAFTISANFNSAAPEKVSLTLDPYGKSTPLTSVTSGQLAGLMSFREQVLGSTRSALDTLASTFVKAVNEVHQQGVDGYGNPGSALFTIDPTASSVAGGIKLAFEDPMRVSAAAQFRVIEEANNTGGADASLSFETPTPTGPATLTDMLVNNPHPSAGSKVTIDASRPLAAVASVPQGMQDVTIYLDDADAGQQLQVITRDGRQLIGQTMDSAMQARMLTEENGFAAGATYSATYLNTSGNAGYKDMTVFYGAKASVLQQPMYDSKGEPLKSQPLAAAMTGSHMTAGQSTGIAANTLTLNGVSLGVLTPAGSTLQASDVATWLNSNISTKLSANPSLAGVTAVASNEIRVSADKLKLTKPLSLNGVAITQPASGFASAQAMADAISAQSASTGVTATISRDGELVLNNVTGQAGKDIKIESTVDALPAANALGNALGLTAGTYGGQISMSRALVTGPTGVTGTDTPIELGFGANGSPADLGKLGFRTAAYLSGTVKEDVMVFVTGAGSASVSASYSGAPVDAKQALRAQPMKITFDSDTHYTITDINTGTVVAARNFDTTQLNPGISYQGLKMSFTSPPKQGDSFQMDGNVDGTGNNDNMLALAALENKALIGSKTLGTAYIDHVNEMGNIARQATIAQSALTVVHDQAVSARDQVAGVSLDQEAADLIRFQQAYQAAAKVLQVSSTLFDSVLQVR